MNICCPTDGFFLTILAQLESAQLFERCIVVRTFTYVPEFCSFQCLNIISSNIQNNNNFNEQKNFPPKIWVGRFIRESTVIRIYEIFWRTVCWPHLSKSQTWRQILFVLELLEPADLEPIPKFLRSRILTAPNMTSGRKNILLSWIGFTTHFKSKLFSIKN